MQLSIDRLNLGATSKAKNKLKWKENKQQKGRWKWKATLHKSGAKRY